MSHFPPFPINFSLFCIFFHISSYAYVCIPLRERGGGNISFQISFNAVQRSKDVRKNIVKIAEGGVLESAHHPFTASHPDDHHLLRSELCLV